jgi:hypothetical protein
LSEFARTACSFELEVKLVHVVSTWSGTGRGFSRHRVTVSPETARAAKSLARVEIDLMGPQKNKRTRGGDGSGSSKSSSQSTRKSHKGRSIGAKMGSLKLTVWCQCQWAALPLQASAGYTGVGQWLRASG